MISVIIPTLNEEEYIGKLLSFLQNHSQKNQLEVIVSDGGSKDETIAIASSYDCIVVKTARPSRALQMNEASKIACGNILYFVHADVGLVDSFVEDIQSAIGQGYKSGGYCCEFVEPALTMLKLNAWFTRLPFRWCRGGDQTLFIEKEFFNKIGGYKEDAVIMEDYFLIDRLIEDGRFKVIQKKVKISARKYQSNPYLKVQLANLRAMKMYRKGVATEKIYAYYKHALH